MKKYLLILISIFVTGFFTSCQEESILSEAATVTAEIEEASKTGEDVTETDLPPIITDYITANYPESLIEGAKMSDKGYGVKLDTGQFLAFDTEGNFVGERRGKPNGHGQGNKPNRGGEEIDPSELPATVTDYITANYPDSSIEGARQSDKGYGVKLDSGVVVIFDADGNFLKERTGKPNGGGHGTEIDPSELPTTITDYITANYPDANIEGARQSDKGYGVKLDSGVVVIFDADGNFVKERTGKPNGGGHGTEIDPSELPTTVTDYITANYPDASIEGARQSDKGYGVKLDSGVVVIFDADGNFLKEKTIGG